MPFARPGAHLTRDFDELLAWLATRMDKMSIARLCRVSWRTGGRACERVVASDLDPGRLDGLFRLGVDEISWRRHHIRRPDVRGRHPRMRTLMVALVVVALVVVAGCGGGGAGQLTTDGSTTGSGTTIDPAKRSAFLGTLALAKPGIVATRRDEGRLMKVGLNTCLALASGTPRELVVAQASKRFSTQGQRVTPAEAERLVSITEQTLCYP